MSERGVLKLTLPPGWRPLRGWVVLVVAVAALNVLTYAALTRPRWFDVTAQSRALEAAREARQLLEPALAEARANYGLVLQAETDLEELHTRIAASATGLSSVMENLEESLQAVGMRFERGTYATERIDELGLVLLQMAVPLSGRYSVVRELVESLAAGDGFMAIDQVGLATPDQPGSGGSLQVELQLAAFLPASAPGEAADAVLAAQAEQETPRRATRLATPAVSNVSPVQRAGELQAQLASLPPLPFSGEAYDVRLDDLDISRKVSEAEGRNLFDYVRPPAPVAQERSRPDKPRGGGRAQSQDARQEQTSSPSHPSLPLRLLGIVRVGSVRYASLTDGTELLVAAEGSSLPGGYEIVEVGIDYAEIKWGEQQVRLTLES